MSEITVDRYNSNEIQNMIDWCQQNLLSGTWTVKFYTDTTKFVFRNKRDSFLFVCKWPQ